MLSGMRFESPWMLLLLLVIPVFVLIRYWRHGTGSLMFSSVNTVRQLNRTWKQNLFWLPSLFRFLALACLVIAIARPQKGKSHVIDSSEGVAIEMVIDRSGSMSEEMSFDGRNLSRLDVVKRVFKEFVAGNKHGLKGRTSDLIGLVMFGTYADTVCPLTLGHDALLQFLKGVKAARTRSEGQTSIGDALALAAARLHKAEDTLKKQVNAKKDFRIKSKVIILLTDGEQTSGKRQPLDAAQIAKEWGVKIYTIGVGGEEAITERDTLFGVFKFGTGRSGVDKETLTALAEETGGKFFMAENADALRNVYAEIDKLERSDVQAIRYIDYDEKFHYFAWAAMALLAIEILLNCTVFRRAP